jgi:hypothetical protein
LREKGGRGFPTLAFLDAEGEVLAKPAQRSVASFSNTADALKTYDRLAYKAKAGNKTAQVDLFIADLDLQKISDLEAAQERLATLPPRSQAQAKRIDSHMLSWEILAIIRDRGKAKKRGQIFYEMWQQNRITTGRYASSFWRAVMVHADKIGDAKALEQALKESKKIAFGKYDNRLKELKARQD